MSFRRFFRRDLALRYVIISKPIKSQKTCRKWDWKWSLTMSCGEKIARKTWNNSLTCNFFYLSHQPTCKKTIKFFPGGHVQKTKNLEFSDLQENFPLEHRRKKTMKKLLMHHKVYLTTDSQSTKYSNQPMYLKDFQVVTLPEKWVFSTFCEKNSAKTPFKIFEIFSQ